MTLPRSPEARLYARLAARCRAEALAVPWSWRALWDVFWLVYEAASWRGMARRAERAHRWPWLAAWGMLG